MRLKIFRSSGVLFVLIFILEVFSFAANSLSWLNTASFFILVGACLAASLYRLEYGLYFLTVDLVIDSFGYFFAAFPLGQNISLRIGFFVAIMLAWAFTFIGARKVHFFRSRLKYIYGGLAFVVMVGLGNGWLKGHSLKDIFLDFNSWTYFLLLLPVYDVFFEKQGDSFRRFMHTLAWVTKVALVAAIIKTFFLLYIFSHNFKSILSPVYKWVRDTRVGEITRVGQNFFRIFFQSHVYPAILGVPMLYSVAAKPASIRASIVLPILLLTVTLISFSRSFWLGGLVVGFFCAVMAWRAAGWKQLVRFLGVSLSAGLAAVLIMFVIVKFPLPAVASDYSLFKSLQDRFRLAGEAAVSTRWQLLGPLWQAIISSPPAGLGIFIGSGFGANVTYKSQDPTVLLANPDGWLTTYAFEWGWLDIWLKIGLVGVVFYAYLLWSLFFKALKLSAPGSVMIASILLSLAVINFFTPYLNHPLGIGLIVFISAYLERLDVGDKLDP